MTEQSLRDALETELKRQGVDEFYRIGELAAALAEVAAAHPVEPAPVITNEAVKAAARALGGDVPFTSQMDDARSALEAAAPLLGPRPLLDREAVEKVVREGILFRDVEATSNAVMALLTTSGIEE